MTDELKHRLAAIDASEEPGPNKLAATCEAMVPALIAERDAAKDRGTRKKLNSRIHTTRMLLRWAKSRAGYVGLPAGN